MPTYTKANKKLRLYRLFAVCASLLGVMIFIAPTPLLEPVKGHYKPHHWTKAEVKHWSKLLWDTDKAKWHCLDLLNTHESQWSWTMRNPNGGAFGIAQALPAKKMASAGRDWRTNPATQLIWQKKYIESRYAGNPCYAWKHETRRGWY